MDHRSSDRTARPQVPQRPIVSQQPAEEYAPTRSQGGWSAKPEQPRPKQWAVVLGIAIVALLVAGVIWLVLAFKPPVPQMPASDRYQAVFLDNGQVFFGKLKNIKGDYLVLEKAFYTKKAEIPADATDEQKAAIEANISLAKVGSEVYGPETSMSIRAEQVLFWQNLQSDSKVAKAIESAN